MVILQHVVSRAHAHAGIARDYRIARVLLIMSLGLRSQYSTVQLDILASSPGHPPSFSVYSIENLGVAGDEARISYVTILYYVCGTNIIIV